RHAEQPAFFAFDCDTGIVAHFGAQAGQRIEERGLAAIGIPGEDDVGVHLRVTKICSASCLRSDKLYPRTLISTGSPNGAKRTNSTGVPTSRPISKTRARCSDGILISVTMAREPTSSEVSGCEAADILRGEPLRFDLLDPDKIGQPRTQAEPR